MRKKCFGSDVPFTYQQNYKKDQVKKQQKRQRLAMF